MCLQKGVVEGVLGGVTGKQKRSHFKEHIEEHVSGPVSVHRRAACCSSLSAFGPNEISAHIQKNSGYVDDLMRPSTLPPTTYTNP